MSLPDFLRNENSKNNASIINYSKYFRLVLWTALSAILVANLPNDEQLTEFLISVIPGQHIQSVGTNLLWAKTCVDFPLPFLTKEQQLQCIPESNKDDSIWVISTPAKSGAVLT